MKEILYFCRSLVDVALLYNLSSLSNYDNLHLLRYYWSNMALIHVSHPHVIFFLLLVCIIYVGIYYLSDVAPIHILHQQFLTQTNPWEIVTIISLCSSHNDIWGRCLCFFTRLPSILTNNDSDILGGCITRGLFSIKACN